MEFAIPAKFKDGIDPSLSKDLKVEERRECNNLIIEAKPVKRQLENVMLVCVRNYLCKLKLENVNQVSGQGIRTEVKDIVNGAGVCSKVRM